MGKHELLRRETHKIAYDPMKCDSRSGMTPRVIANFRREYVERPVSQEQVKTGSGSFEGYFTAFRQRVTVSPNSTRSRSARKRM